MGSVSPIDGHIDGAERCVVCGKVIPEGRQVCVICGHKVGQKQTNYDRIRNMSVEGMAELFTAIFHEEYIKMATRLKANGIDCSLVELDHDIQIAIHKQWLESEVEGE